MLNKSLFACGTALAVMLGAGQFASAAEYKLAYWYEVPGSTNQSCPITGGCGCSGTGNHSLYAHVWDYNGNPLGNKRLENVNNPAQFGITNNNPNDKMGFTEIPLYANDTPKLAVNDSALPSEVTPLMIEARFPTYGHYSWECGFIYIPDGITATFDTTLLGIPNLSSIVSGCEIDAPTTRSRAYYDANPDNWSSDAYSLDSSAGSFGQTFKATGNRVVVAKFQVTIGALADLKYAVRIRDGGPTGAYIGNPAVSRLIKSDEYFTQLVRWPLLGNSAIPVVPGQTYYAEIVRADAQGTLNIWKRDNDVYPHGQMFRNGQPVAGKDLMGQVVCGTVIDQPMIKLSTSALGPNSNSCGGLLTQSFTVKKEGPGTLIYNVTTNQPWLFTLPVNGISTGEEDTITVYIKTAGLTLGVHNAQITITADDSYNSPQAIAVQLNITKRATPGDLDGDCDVDQSDFGIFQRCLTGPTGLQEDPTCIAARLDTDADVDLDDFGVFQKCLRGANVPANPDCAN